MRCPDQRAARDGVLHRSALKSAQIRTLISTGDLQLTLFDQTNLAEITSEEFPGERLVVCRNPSSPLSAPANATRSRRMPWQG
jgi:hypothetical protein